MSTPDTAPILSSELLDDLEQRWRALRVPIASRLRPGLTDREIDETTAPIGLALPPEARTWFGWHDGASDGGMYIGPVSYEFASLEVLVAGYRGLRDIDAKTGIPESFWPRTTFPLVSGQLPIICDCRAHARTQSPIYVHDPATPIVLDDPVAWSFGQVVTWWIEAIDDGDWIGDERGWSGRPPRSARPDENRPGHRRYKVI